MEILTEIRIDARTAMCALETDSIFHLNLHGYEQFVGKKVFARVKDLVFPKLNKNINFSMYCGKKRRELLDETDVKQLSIDYQSIEELCMKLNFEAQCLIESKTCKNTTSDHVKHVCDDLNITDNIFSVVNNVVTIKLPENCALVVTTNVAVLLGFDDIVIGSYSLNEKRGKSKGQLLSNVTKPIKFVGKFFVGHPIEFYEKHERFCHFAFPSLTAQCTYFNVPQNVLFTYDVKNDRISGKDEVRLITPTLNFPFYLLNDDLDPFAFSKNLREIDLRFTLQFFKSV